MPPRNSKSKSAAAPKAVAPPVSPVVVQAAATQRSEAKGSGSAAPRATTARTITPEMIAKRAYEIYANRGYAAGDQTADWLEAERQLKAGL